jgi:hypothetical protein
MLGLARGAGAVVLIEGVARPLGPTLCLAVAGTLGALEWRDVRVWCRPARGVADGSSAIDGFLRGMGVDGRARVVGGASDRGGEGGVVSG